MPSWTSSRAIARAAVGILLCALPGCGGGGSPTAPPPTVAAAPPTTTLAPVPTKLPDLSASVTSPQANASISCDGPLRATVALTNRGATSVVATGVLVRFGVVFGNCGGDFEFTYRALSRTIAPGATTLVLDQALFSGPVACCQGGHDCAGSCRFQDGVEVVTELGNVPAGAFNYTVFFQNCRACSGAAATGAGCPRPAAFGPTS
jgi:hypothetical protein